MKKRSITPIIDSIKKRIAQELNLPQHKIDYLINLWFKKAEHRAQNPMQPSFRPLWGTLTFSRNKGRRKLKILWELLNAIYDDQENAYPKFVANQQTLDILGHFLGRTLPIDLPPYLQMFNSPDLHLTDFAYIRSLKNPVLTRVWMFEKTYHLQKRKDLEWKKDYGSKLDTYNTWKLT